MNLVAVAVCYWSCFKYFYQEKANTGLLSAYLIVWLITICLFCSTTFRDPGMIGRQSDTDFSCEARELAEIQRMREDPLNFQNGVFRPVRMSQNSLYTANNKVFYLVRDSRQTTLRPMRFCVECNIYRPPVRCSHCYNCNGCVIGFDHHCVWLGTCIGTRNYLDFMCFLISITSLIVLSEFCLWKEITEVNQIKDASLSTSLRERLHISFAIPFCFVFLLMIGLLLGFHFFLICKNVTTHEYLKGIYKFDDSKSNSHKYKVPTNSTINPYNIHHSIISHLN